MVPEPNYWAVIKEHHINIWFCFVFEKWAIDTIFTVSLSICSQNMLELVTRIRASGNGWPISIAIRFRRIWAILICWTWLLWVKTKQKHECDLRFCKKCCSRADRLLKRPKTSNLMTLFLTMYCVGSAFCAFVRIADYVDMHVNSCCTLQRLKQQWNLLLVVYSYCNAVILSGVILSLNWVLK